MNPPAEQLIRDYLNRVSVAALARLSSDERREFLARIREELERETRGPGGTDQATVRRLLSALGRPEALVELERARLALQEGQPAPATRRPGRLLARPAAWVTRGWAQLGSAVRPPQEPVPEPVSSLPLTGEIKVSSRPITARRRPGGPLPPPRPGRPNRRFGDLTAAGQEEGSAAGQEEGSAAGQEEGSAAGQEEGSAAGQEEGSAAGQQEGSAAGQQNGTAAPAAPPPQVTEARAGAGAAADPGQGPAGASGRNWDRFQAMLSSKPDPAGTPPGPAGMPGKPAAQPGQRARQDGRGTGAEDRGPVAGLLSARAANLATAVARFARQHPVETTAIVLLGLGGLIYPPVWLLGAAVAVASTHWDFRDKWVGLAGPPLLVIVGTGIGVALGGKHHSAGAYAHEAWVLADHLSRLLAVIGAAFLARRVQRGRRGPAPPPWNRPHRI
jgi:hypothetical protein